MRVQWRARSALAVTVVLASLPMQACLGRNCESTKLTLKPIDRTALNGPVTLEARLTSGGQGIVGAPIAFFVQFSQEDAKSGLSVGGADTDAEGYARRTIKEGLAQFAPLRPVDGYTAEFRIRGSVPGRENQLCRSRGDYRFT